MEHSLKPIVRNLQTHFPFLHDLRFKTKLWKQSTFGSYHETDFELLKQLTYPENAILIDVGANRGEALQSMLNACPRGVKLVAFEPNPLVFNQLKKHFKTHKNITLHPVGLGSERKILNLFVPFYRNWMFDGLASFNQQEARDWLKNRMWRFNSSLLSVRSVTCSIQPLDAFELSPCFVKIDVQGFELEVLKGMKNTIKRSLPILLIENLQRPEKEFLKPYGYAFFSYKKGRLVPEENTLNTFCLPSSKQKELLH